MVRYKSFLYQAASWTRARRVVAKVEFHFGELFPRVGIAVTSLTTCNRAVVRFYNNERRGKGLYPQKQAQTCLCKVLAPVRSESDFKMEIPVYSQAPAFIAGLCAAEIREELLRARDLSKKGSEKRQREYAERTAGKTVRQAEFRLKDRVISRLSRV